MQSILDFQTFIKAIDELFQEQVIINSSPIPRIIRFFTQDSYPALILEGWNYSFDNFVGGTQPNNRLELVFNLIDSTKDDTQSCVILSEMYKAINNNSENLQNKLSSSGFKVINSFITNVEGKPIQSSDQESYLQHIIKSSFILTK